MPGFQIATVTPDGKECAAGEPGLLAIDRTSPLFWFKGYDQRSEQPFMGNYYITGDSAVREADGARSEEHTSELQSLMRISYAVFCLNKKNTTPSHNPTTSTIHLYNNT